MCILIFCTQLQQLSLFDLLCCKVMCLFMLCLTHDLVRVKKVQRLIAVTFLRFHYSLRRPADLHYRRSITSIKTHVYETMLL
jgi:hypothetical protein